MEKNRNNTKFLLLIANQIISKKLFFRMKKKPFKKQYLRKSKYLLLIFFLIIEISLYIRKKLIDKENKEEEQKELKLWNEKYKQQLYYHNNQINVEDPYKTNQGYHPKVISFEKPWNGYKYWMAFTPYPYRKSNRENPCINVSNDLKNWKCPQGLINPLSTPLPGYYNYNSDSHLLYNEETNQLEVFWRWVSHSKVVVFTRASSDGINWSPKKEFLRTENRYKIDYLSPSIIRENGKYRIWFVSSGNRIYYMEKNDKMKTTPRFINITFHNNLRTWHLDVIHNKKKNIYELLVVAYSSSKYLHYMPLFYSFSKDNKKWSFPVVILEKSKNPKNFDARGLYKSSVLYLNNTYYLFYSGHTKGSRVGIGLVYGKNIKYLRPYM